MTSERLFNSFIPPKNFYTPKQISGYAPADDADDADDDDDDDDERMCFNVA